MRTLLALLISCACCFGQQFRFGSQALLSTPQSGGLSLTPGYMEWWSADTITAANNAAINGWIGANGFLASNYNNGAGHGGVFTNSALNGHSAIWFGTDASHFGELDCLFPKSQAAPWVCQAVIRIVAGSSFETMFGSTNNSLFYAVTDSGGDNINWGTSLNSAPSFYGKTYVFTLINSNSVASCIVTNYTIAAQGAFGNTGLEGYAIGAVGGNLTFPLVGFITDTVLYTNGLTWNQITNNVAYFRNKTGI